MGTGIFDPQFIRLQSIRWGLQKIPVSMSCGKAFQFQHIPQYCLKYYQVLQLGIPGCSDDLARSVGACDPHTSHQLDQPMFFG